jgi:glycosyltransferase involved in cell wall biosynthesis
METLSIIIPCYNEEKTIQKVVNQVANVVLPGSIQKEIIIVDDGSTDSSREIIQALANEPRSGVTIKPIFQPQNGGKGTAVITGFKNATGDYIVIQDGDLEYSPEEYPSLIGPIHDGHADVVYGSRFTGNGPHRVFNFHHYLANKLITFLSNIFTNLNLTDVEVGHKAYSKAALEKILSYLSSSRFGIEIELTARAAQASLRIYEVSISYRGRSYDEGKKIGWKDGVAALWFIFYYNIIKRS